MQLDLRVFRPRVPRVGWDFLLDKACFAYPLKKGTQTRSKENSFDAEQMSLLGYIEFAWIINNPICKVSLFRGVLTLAASVRFDFYGAKLGCKAKLCNMYFKRWMHFSPNDVIFMMSINRAPVWLNNNAFVLHDFLQFRHNQSAFFRIRDCKRFSQKAIELRVRKGAFVPGFTWAIGQRKNLNT